MKLFGTIAARIICEIVLTVAFLILTASALPAQTSLNGVSDLNGRPADPFKGARGKVVVLVFVRTDCPISNRYAPTIQDLSSRYKSQAVFFLVYPIRVRNSGTDSKSSQEFGYRLRAIRDSESVLAQESQVKVTPESAVFSVGSTPALSRSNRRLVPGFRPCRDKHRRPTNCPMRSPPRLPVSRLPRLTCQPLAAFCPRSHDSSHVASAMLRCDRTQLFV